MFRALTGETIFHDVTRVRLRAAVRLLLERADASVSDIAAAVGYDTPSSFNKLFKKALGTSPTRFRALSGVGRASLLARLEDPDTSALGVLDLSVRPDHRERADRTFLFARRCGVCSEEAPGAWVEFDRLVGRTRLLERDIEFVGATFRSAPCLEIYLNDPRTVPQDELVTELCLPVV